MPADQLTQPRGHRLKRVPGNPVAENHGLLPIEQGRPSSYFGCSVANNWR